MTITGFAGVAPASHRTTTRLAAAAGAVQNTNDIICGHNFKVAGCFCFRSDAFGNPLKGNAMMSSLHRLLVGKIFDIYCFELKDAFVRCGDKKQPKTFGRVFSRKDV